MNTTSRTETIERTERPWGWYETVSEVSGNKVKRIRVHPGQQNELTQAQVVGQPYRKHAEANVER